MDQTKKISYYSAEGQDAPRAHMKPNSTYINLPKAERNYPIYRIMSLERLFQMFDESSNYLVRPRMWEDPFENFISNLQGRLPDGELVEFAQRYDFYGQCWTLTGGTDAMWRIYSADKQSVRIKVRLSDLFKAISSVAQGIPFIGRVKYLQSSALIPWTRRVVRSTKRPSLELLAKTFLVKRGAFSHENEVRLLYCSAGGPEDGDKVYRHPLECRRVVSEIMLDPRLNKAEAETIAAEVRRRTQYKGRIRQSDLYAPPDQFFLRLGPSYAVLNRTKARVTYEGDGRQTTWRPDGVSQVVLPFR
jgi:hypothetical protein